MVVKMKIYIIETNLERFRFTFELFDDGSKRLWIDSIFYQPR